MKKLEEIKKQKLNRVRKGERGSITLFVLIAMMFFLTVGIAIYIANVNNSTTQQRDVKKIQSEYNDGGDLNQIYYEQKNKIVQNSL